VHPLEDALQFIDGRTSQRIMDFVGPVITSGMMAGVGIMLAKVSIDMARKNHIVGFSSMIVGSITYLLTKNLVYTITVSV
jgi:AGZA family xanthine/uracil permease-like MFS transporter